MFANRQESNVVQVRSARVVDVIGMQSLGENGPTSGGAGFPMIVVVGSGAGETLFADLEKKEVWQAVSAITDDATVELSPCGKRIAVAGKDRVLRILDASSGDLVHSFCAHDREVCALSWGENNLIASCAVDGKISVWDPALPACCRATCHSMQLWRAEEGPYRVRRGTFIRGWATWLDRDTVAAGDFMGQAVKWCLKEDNWDVLHMKSTLDQGTVHLAALSPDWETMAVCCRASGCFQLMLWDVPTCTTRAHITRAQDWNEHWNPYTMCFSPRGSRLAVSSDDKRIRVWRLSARGTVQGRALRMQRFAIFATCVTSFTPDGALLIGACQDDNLRTWDANSGVLTATIPLCALQGEVCSLAFSPEWLRARRIAFAMALHERLGAASVARVLSLEPLMLVLELMVA